MKYLIHFLVSLLANVLFLIRIPIAIMCMFFLVSRYYKEYKQQYPEEINMWWGEFFSNNMNLISEGIKAFIGIYFHYITAAGIIFWSIIIYLLVR